MRPLIETPKWDGKIVLAGMFIVGYYSLVFIMAWRPLPATNAGLVRDAMLTLGPVVGLIFGSLFRSTAADERSAARRDETLQRAIVPLTNGSSADDVREGARAGTREGVSEGLDGRTDGSAEPLT